MTDDKLQQVARNIAAGFVANLQPDEALAILLHALDLVLASMHKSDAEAASNKIIDALATQNLATRR
jgi:hypothetical protein